MLTFVITNYLVFRVLDCLMSLPCYTKCNNLFDGNFIIQLLQSVSRFHRWYTFIITVGHVGHPRISCIHKFPQNGKTLDAGK